MRVIFTFPLVTVVSQASRIFPRANGKSGGKRENAKGKTRLVTCALHNGMQLFTKSREWSCYGTLYTCPVPSVDSSLLEDKAVYFEVASISRVSCGGRQTALITRLCMQNMLQSCEYASKA